MTAAAHYSPKGLAGKAVLGGLLVSSPFFLSGLWNVPRFSVPGCGVWALLQANWLRLAVLFPPVVSGIFLSLKSEKRLRRGVTEDLWSEEELQSLRKRLKHPAWTALAFMALTGWPVAALVFPQYHRESLFWGLLIFAQGIQRLEAIVRSQVRPSERLRGWNVSAPIRSEHWGEPPHIG